MNMDECVQCPFSDVQEDCIKCMYGVESYPDVCPKKSSLDFLMGLAM
jgi:hypothetical protein